MAKKNPGYWRGWPAGKFTTLNLRHVYEPETQRLMIEKGELDIAENVTKDSLPALKRNASLTVYEKAGTTLMVTFLNTQAGPTKDLRVRQALHHLWNQEAFNAITGNAANAGPLYAPLLGRDWKMENPYPYDPARAKQLLAEAGFPNGGFQLRYQSQKGDADKRAIFEIFQAELSKLNIGSSSSTTPGRRWSSAPPTGGRRATPAPPCTCSATSGRCSSRRPTTSCSPCTTPTRIPRRAAATSPTTRTPSTTGSSTSRWCPLDAAREQRQLRQAAELLWKDAAVVVNGRIVDKIVTRKDVKGFVYEGDRISYRYWDMSRER